MKFEKSIHRDETTIGDLVKEATEQGKILIFNTMSFGKCLAVDHYSTLSTGLKRRGLNDGSVVYLSRTLKFKGTANARENYSNNARSRVVGYIDLADEVSI